MRLDYQRYLVNTFPKIYVVDKPTPFGEFGIECDDGWFRLLVWLSRYLQQYIDQQNICAEKFPDTHQKVEQVVVCQVKEKMGILNFYVTGGNERTKSVISFASFISGFICEVTGKTNDIGFNKNGYKNGCIKTKHKSLSTDTDFTFVDDKELRELFSGKSLTKQSEFNFV